MQSRLPWRWSLWICKHVGGWSWTEISAQRPRTVMHTCTRYNPGEIIEIHDRSTTFRGSLSIRTLVIYYWFSEMYWRWQVRPSNGPNCFWKLSRLHCLWPKCWRNASVAKGLKFRTGEMKWWLHRIEYGHFRLAPCLLFWSGILASVNPRMM